jgi:hypothetical protein
MSSPKGLKAKFVNDYSQQISNTPELQLLIPAGLYPLIY